MTLANSKSTSLDTTVGHYGVNETFIAKDAIDRHMEEIFYLGYTVVENVLSPEQVKKLGDTNDRVYAEQIEELGGEDLAAKVNDAKHIRCPLAYDDVFVDLAKQPMMLEMMRRMLGQNFVLMMQNAIINPPAGNANYQTHWHRDLNYQHWTSSKVLAANALFCIDPFSAETGGTYVLPGSHLREAFPTEAFVQKHQRVVTAPAGSMIVMNGMVYHRAGKNTSPRVRRAVNHVMGLPFMAQQIDIPAFVGDRLATDDFSRNYFGYRWKPAASAKEWRMAKLPK